MYGSKIGTTVTAADIHTHTHTHTSKPTSPLSHYAQMCWKRPNIWYGCFIYNKPKMVNTPEESNKVFFFKMVGGFK